MTNESQAEDKPQSEPTPKDKMRPYPIAAASIIALGAIIAAVIGLSSRLRPPKTTLEIPGEVLITGRVANLRTDEPIRKAEVALEAAGVPSRTETDSKGIFSAQLRRDYVTVRIRVTARDYEPYDQLLPRNPSTSIIPISLTPTAVSSTKPSHGGPPSGPAIAPASVVPVVVRAPEVKPPPILNTYLRETSGENGPWSVIVFGDQDGRTEIVEGLQNALRLDGKETVSLFRKQSDEQRLAPELFRGSNDVFRELQIGRYVSRLFVGKLTVVRNGDADGITFATAKLTLHLVSPEAEILRSFELFEKDGGNDEDHARRRAVEALISLFQREVPKRIQ
jgi:hypothetical protein